GKVHFIIRDHDDNSNGAAYYYDQKVEIWAPALDFELRGTHHWIANVVTHEFSHIISLGAARKFSRRLPAFYFQWIGYEKERRPDVIYGYPNVIVSYPLAGTVIPMWFAEGMAQYQRAGLNHDFWDTHRDMLLRTAVLADSLLTYHEMNVFGKNSLGNERVYNQGFALTLYISRTYGEPTVSKLARAMRSPFRLTFDGAVRKVLHKSAQELYEEWARFLAEQYHSALTTVRENAVEGKIIYGKGIANLHPRFSPDGRKIAFTSSRGAGYFSASSLCLYDVNTHKTEVLVPGVISPASWTPDGKSLVYARRTRVNRHGSHYFDLFRVDVKTKKARRLTRGLRAYAPDVSPDGKQIVCVVQHDGTQNLALVDIDGTNFRKLTHYRNGETVYTPRWSPDGRRIVFALGKEHGRLIASANPATGEVDTVFAAPGESDARDPSFSPDGKTLYFAWDGSGIFDIYRMPADGGMPEPVTNVLGGAFSPSVDGKGNLAYSDFRASGFKLALLEGVATLPSNLLAYGLSEDWLAPEPTVTAGTDGKGPVTTAAKPYTPEYGAVAFLPRFAVDYGEPKIGSYFYSSEVLERYSVLGGASTNRDLDYDLFAIFEYRRYAPTIFLELYGFSRHLDEPIEVLEGY
ncbi:MAG TPA: biopolymer transporter Tol, partial [Bacteroidetes bacterium]|nr:biopolymer transporter Tol [Bacteroidota bacterium]